MKNKTAARIGILTAATCSLSYLAFSPVIASISAAFPETDVSLVQMIMTLPSLLFIVFSPLSGKLMQFVPKKNLAVFSIFLYLIGGLFPFFFHGSVWQILAGSAVMGCGSGMLMPVLNSIICDHFEEKERGQLMGLNATFVALGALLFSFVSGQLARLGWQYSFLSFLLIIPVLLISLKFLPKSSSTTVGQESHGKFQLSPYIVFLFVIGIIYFTMQNAYNTNSSLYISDMGIGNADTASTAVMCNTVGGIIGGVCFGVLAAKSKQQIETVALVMSGAGFLLCFFLPSLVPILVGGLLVGFGFAVFNAAGTYLLSKSVKPENNAFTSSVYMALINLGAALSPMAVNGLSAFFGQGTGIRFLVTGMVIVACAVVSAITNGIPKRN